MASSSSSFTSVDRLEVAAGDLVRLVSIMGRSVDLPGEIMDAVEALDEAVERRAAGFAPEGPQAIIEMQAKRIRALEEQLRDAVRRVGELADERDAKEREAPSSTHNQDAVCVRCGAIGRAHGAQGQCPAGAKRPRAGR